MTATPAPKIASDSDRGALDWADRSAFGSMRGLPWWGAVLLATLSTAVGTLADVLIWSKPGMLFTACYLVGCLLAIALVRRGSLFGPAVQPPLVLAIAMPAVVLAVGANIPDGAGTTDIVLAVASPLINGFPVMAATTALVLGVCLLRVFVLQRKHPHSGKGAEEASPDATTKRAAPQPAAARKSGKSEASGGAKAPPAGRGGSRPPDGRSGPADGAKKRTPGRGSGPRPPAKGAEAQQPPGAKPRRGDTGRSPAPARGRSASDQGQPPGRQRPASGSEPKAAPGKQGARPKKQGSGGQRPSREGGQRQGPPSGGQPQGSPQGEGNKQGGGAKPQPGNRPAPGRGNQRQTPPGRGKPAQRPSGEEPPRRPQRPRRDGR